MPSKPKTFGRKHEPRRSLDSRKWRWLYQTQGWQQIKKKYEYDLCAICHRIRLKGNRCVDHKMPHNGDLDVFWDENNHQPLCMACHSAKTAKQDGAFGNMKGSL